MCHALLRPTSKAAALACRPAFAAQCRERIRAPDALICTVTAARQANREILQIADSARLPIASMRLCAIRSGSDRLGLRLVLMDRFLSAVGGSGAAPDVAASLCTLSRGREARAAGELTLDPLSEAQ